MNSPPPITTVFLDRDGVINEDSPDYIKSWAEFHLIPGSPKAIARLTAAGIPVIVITNQSAIHRNLISLADLTEMHRNMRRAIAAEGGSITDILFCPHGPDEGCGCRKPEPGLILEARNRHTIDLAQAVMIGDSVRDIQAGTAAGCGTVVLVETGNGKRAQKVLRETGPHPDHIAADLDRAVQWILDRQP